MSLGTSPTRLPHNSRVMGKYDPLQRRLESGGSGPITMSFAELDKLVGGLPRSASIHRVWWNNEPASNTRHVQSLAWLNAGRAVDHVVLSEWVRFSGR
jgi:hypothetical protein